MKQKLTISNSLALLLVSFAAAFLLIVAFLLTRNFRQINTEYKRNLQFRSTLFKESIEQSIVMGDYSAVYEKAQSFFGQSDVASLNISLMDGTKLTSFSKDQRRKDADAEFGTSESININDNMNDTKHSIATLEVIFELSNLKDILSGFLRQGLTASVLFLILAAIMISYFSRLFNLPLKKMSQVALSGDLQLISKVKTDSKIVEISMLESAIRKMGEQILDLNEKDRENFKNAAIGRIIAHLTHDLRAPLGTFERLLQTPDEKMPTMRSAVKDSLNRLNSMIESLRHSEVENLVKKSASKINFPFGRESLQGKADDHKIALLIPTEDPGKVWIDPMKVERAWINLASNAIEAAKSFVRVEAGKQDTSLFIRVIDDGPGVPDNILPKLFQRGMTSDKAGGTGLGLAYVRQVMQGHGGDVTYRRENGLTIFECFLPHAVDRNEAETLAEKESQVIEKEVKTKQISVCFTPDSYGESLITHLVNFQNPRFKFTNAYKDDSEVVVTNDDDLSMKSLNEGKETIKISKALTAEELASRLAYRLNIKS